MTHGSLSPAEHPSVARRGGEGPPPILVEFIGLPGAGKSSAAARLSTTLQQRGLRARLIDTENLVRGDMRRFKARYRSLAEVASKETRSRSGCTECNHKERLSLLARFALTYEGALQEDCDVLLLPEGFAKRGMSIYSCVSSEAVHEPACMEYAGQQPVPDLLLALRAPLEVCLGRVRGRRTPSRLDGMDPADADRFMRSMEACQQMILATLVARGAKVLEADAALAEPLLHAGLVDALDGHLAKARC